AADEVDAIEILEAVPRSEVEHLSECVRQVECRTLVDCVARLPVLRRDNLLESDPAIEVGYAQARQLVEKEGPERGLLAFPVDVRGPVGYRCKDVKSTHPPRGQCRVGDRGILNIERRIDREPFIPFDVVEVLDVVPGCV